MSWKMNQEKMTTATILELRFELDNLRLQKRNLKREIDNIDTEMIGIKEELRKREEIRLDDPNWLTGSRAGC